MVLTTVQHDERRSRRKTIRDKKSGTDTMEVEEEDKAEMVLDDSADEHEEKDNEKEKENKGEKAIEEDEVIEEVAEDEQLRRSRDLARSAELQKQKQTESNESEKEAGSDEALEKDNDRPEGEAYYLDDLKVMTRRDLSRQEAPIETVYFFHGGMSSGLFLFLTRV